MMFNSHDVEQDRRTSLNLSPGALLNLGKDFTLDFDLSFLPYKQVYFGYIFRLIGKNNNNIDLIYDETQFKIVFGDRLSGISFPVKTQYLYSSWNHFCLRVDSKTNTITLLCRDQQYTKTISFPLDKEYQLFFGLNTYREVRTTDVPPMKLKDVRIAIAGKPTYHWPLNEGGGRVCHEEIQGNDGISENPVWIKISHYQWNIVKKVRTNGPVSTAFDAQRGIIFIVTTDSIVTYSDDPASQKSYRYKTPQLNVAPTNQSICVNHNVFNFNIDEKTVLHFDFEKRDWEDRYPYSGNLDYWHANKFYCQKDSSLYFVGGYGHHEYKNTVHKCELANRQWSVVQTSGDILTPRYLAGLGTTTLGDTAYIIGGYGNASGKQLLRPENVYDLVRFTTKDHSFKKLFDFKADNGDFVFANSLIIDQQRDRFYGLIFPSYKSNAHLQLIEGSLSKPEIKNLGGTVPYKFHDVHAFADLFYCPKTKTFFLSTAFTDANDRTDIQIYSLLGPPELASMTSLPPENKSFFWYIMAIAAILTLTISFWVLRRKTRIVNVANAIPLPTPEIETEVKLSVVDTLTNPVLPPTSDQKEKDNPASLQRQGAINLFGGLQIISTKELDITVHFTPLLKELFLIILLYTVRKKNGVGSHTLNELLWFDKSEQSAKNNRSVNIAKLKAILSLIGNCHISKESGLWKFNFDPKIISVDYYNYVQLVANKNNFTREKILLLMEITRGGSFLTNIEYEWLDSFKSDISFEIVDIYIHYATSIKLTDEPDLIINLANHILYFDPVHEEALVMKCKALEYLGNHLLAKAALESFKKEYFKIYAEVYSRDLADILK